MGVFTKRGRIKLQEELLRMARRAMDALHVKPAVNGDGVVGPNWDARAVPLEYRKYVALHLETLVFYVHDPAAAEFWGTMDAIGELQEALTFVQVALTDRFSITNQTELRRKGLRAHAFADVFESIAREIPAIEDWSAGKNPLGAWFPPQHDGLLEDAAEALGWFRSQEELEAANSVRSVADKRPYPPLSLAALRDATERLRTLKPPARPDK